MAHSTHGKTWTGTGLFALAGLFCIGFIGFLTYEVAKDLRRLESASSDNVQWTLSQTEVEFLEFEVHLTQALEKDVIDLKKVRREFDIFYSRVNTLSSGSIYAPLQGNATYKEELETLRAFLDRNIAVIDSPDAVLVQALPTLLEDTHGLHFTWPYRCMHF